MVFIVCYCKQLQHSFCYKLNNYIYANSLIHLEDIFPVLLNRNDAKV